MPLVHPEPEIKDRNENFSEICARNVVSCLRFLNPYAMSVLGIAQRVVLAYTAKINTSNRPRAQYGRRGYLVLA
eukprot:3931482-Rhodomonas_salina.1